MENFIYNQMKPNEQKLRFQGIAHVFFGFQDIFLYVWISAGFNFCLCSHLNIKFSGFFYHIFFYEPN